MGLLDFLKDKGKDLFGGNEDNAAETIKKEVERALGSNVSNLGVQYSDGKVRLSGSAKSQAAKEKATLIAGNVKGVSNVNDDALMVAGEQMAKSSSTYYTIQSGDTLSKIAAAKLGNASDYTKIFEANREVIEDPDKIYPGQVIRIPA
ncbi:MAG: peptidoglycan-binding protein LysM [Rubricoccaceae bacterium]